MMMFDIVIEEPGLYTYGPKTIRASGAAECFRKAIAQMKDKDALGFCCHIRNADVRLYEHTDEGVVEVPCKLFQHTGEHGRDAVLPTLVKLAGHRV